MRAKEFIVEFNEQPPEEYGGLGLEMMINPMINTLRLTAREDGKDIGFVLFQKRDMRLYPLELEVNERFRGQGVAQTMYDYLKQKGYKIHRSHSQTDAGAGFWDKHRGKSATVWEDSQTRDANLRAWFGKSKVVDQAGNPLRVYHGTGSDFSIFSLGHRTENQGIDQYGTGFYFAEDPSVASGYTHGDSANVMPVYLRIQKPMTTTTPAFRKPIVEKLIKASPNYLDALRDFGDVDHYGERAVLSSTVDAFLDYENAIVQLNTIQHDFYRDHPDAFVNNLYKITGFDGVAVPDFGYGRVWVVFSPTQIKSATGNSGKYDSSNADITTE